VVFIGITVLRDARKVEHIPSEQSGRERREGGGREEGARGGVEEGVVMGRQIEQCGGQHAGEDGQRVEETDVFSLCVMANANHVLVSAVPPPGSGTAFDITR
jgi:hypothetical protein